MDDEPDILDHGCLGDHCIILDVGDLDHALGVDASGLCAYAPNQAWVFHAQCLSGMVKERVDGRAELVATH